MKKLNIFLLLVAVSFMSCGKNDVGNSTVHVDEGQQQIAKNSLVPKQLFDNVKSDPFFKVSRYSRMEVQRADYEIKIGGNKYFRTYRLSSTPVAGSEQTYFETYNRINHIFGQTRSAVIDRILNILNSATQIDTTSGNWGFLVGNTEYYFNFSSSLSDNPVQIINRDNNIINKVSGYRMVAE